MLDRVIDRLPALLLLALLALLVQATVFEVREPGRLVAGIPAFLLLLLYLRAGSGGAKKQAKAAK